MRIAVVGAGVLGAMTAWRLADRGVDVVVYERFAVGHDRGSSHGSTRIFRRAVFEGPQYAPLVALSTSLWNQLSRRDSSAGLDVTGGLTIGPASSALINGAMAAGMAAGADVEFIEHDRLRASFPQHVLALDDVAVFEPGAGVLRAEASTRAAIGQSVRCGVAVEEDTRVTGIDRRSDGVTLCTTRGEDRVDAVVVAAGAELGALVPELARALTIERSLHVWFRSDGRVDWSARSAPVFVRGSGVLQGWGIGDFGDGLVKVGVTTAKPAVTDLESYLSSTEVPAHEDVAAVERFVGDGLVGLEPQTTEAVFCLNTHTGDGDFVVGTHPDDCRIVVVGGGSGHAFKHAPALGEVAACLALGTSPPVAVDCFSPSRFITG